ncbi:MAG: transcription antitermination factor NusB [Brevinema sp.]
MIKTYPLNPKRLERLLIVQGLQQDRLPTSEEDVKFLVPDIVKYDVQDIYPSLPPEVQRRIIRNVLETVSVITADKEKLIAHLSKAIHNRPFSAMFPIDQALLLLGAYEFEHNQSEPKIIVKEILICSDTLSNEKAGAYLSGILKTLVAYAENPNFTPARKPLHERTAGRRPARVFLKGEGGEHREHRSYGDKPSYREGGEHREHRSYGDKPSYREGGEHREHRSYGDKPSYREGGEHREHRSYGDKPSYRDGGERREHRSYGDKPSYREGGERREHRSYGDKPSYREGGERQERRSYGDKPSYRDGGERQERRSYGDKPSYNKNNNPRRQGYGDDSGQKNY